MSGRVLLRAHSGPVTGMGHAMRSRSIAQEILALGGDPLVVVDDEATRTLLAADGLEVRTIGELPDWAECAASGAWLDGFVDWTDELKLLRERDTPSFLAENRGPARAFADRVVYPALHYVPDHWDEKHAGRVFAGPGWIPLAREVRGAPVSRERDVDLFVTFGGSDPYRLTERVLGALGPTDLRVVVAVGPHMADRREALARCVEGQPTVRVLDPGTPLALWMGRSRAAITAVGTTLYELAYLGVASIVLANYSSDHEALAWYDAHGPHLPLGIASELSEEGLRSALRSGLAELARRPAPHVPELGEGAARLAEWLLGRAA